MKASKKTCDQHRCTLCKLCHPSWHPAISAHKKNMHFKRGEALFTEGTELKGIFYLYEGQAKIHKHWADGRELIVRFASEGEIVGHRGLGLDRVYPVSATAMTAVTACFFPLKFFLDTLEVNQQFANDLLWFFAAELKTSERRMHQLMLVPAKARLAETLLFLQQKFGVDADGYINVSLSKQDIASFSGTTYETSFRMYQEMQAEALIEVNGKQIKLLDQKGLAELTHPDTYLPKNG